MAPAIARPDFIEGMARGMAVLESFSTERQRLNATLAAQRAGATAPLARGLKDLDLPAQFGRAHRSGQAGPAAADHGQPARWSVLWLCGPQGGRHSRPSACTFQASQSLRSGVRLTRRVSTSCGSRAISCSRVRYMLAIIRPGFCAWRSCAGSRASASS